MSAKSQKRYRAINADVFKRQEQGGIVYEKSRGLGFTGWQRRLQAAMLLEQAITEVPKE